MQPNARFDYVAQREVLLCCSMQDPTHPNANVGDNRQHVLNRTKDMKGWARGENESIDPRPKGTHVATGRFGINEGGYEKKKNRKNQGEWTIKEESC